VMSNMLLYFDWVHISFFTWLYLYSLACVTSLLSLHAYISRFKMLYHSLIVSMLRIKNIKYTILL
jgi:hypothetical protein